MDMRKIAFGLALTTAFGLLACGDDESSSPIVPNNDPVVSSSSVATEGDATSSSSETVSGAENTNVAASSGDAAPASSTGEASAKSSGSVAGFDLGDMGQACANEGEKKDGKITYIVIQVYKMQKRKKYQNLYNNKK